MEYGFSGATIDDVADRIRATKGRVYHYYRSKVDLFLDVHLAAMTIMIDSLQPVFAANAPAAERLYGMAYRHAMAIMDNFAYQKVSIQGLERPLISMATSRSDAVVDRVVELRDQYEAMFADVIGQGMADGSFEPGRVRLMTKPLLGALNWLTLWYRPEHEPDKAGRNEIAVALARYAVRGLRKDGGDDV